MSCGPKYNCWQDKYVHTILIMDRSRCTHQQMRLKPGFCYADNTPIMVCPKDPMLVMPWAPGNKLIGVLQCGDDLTDSTLEYCPAEVWCAACFNVDAIAWPVDPEGGELQQQINDEITAMMLPDAQNVGANIKLQRMTPVEC